jgi:phage terminase large subunit GpA-like protein
VQHGALAGGEVAPLACVCGIVAGMPLSPAALALARDLQPRDSDARDFMQAEFEAICDASPCLKDVFTYEVGGRGRTRGNLVTRFFPGGSLRALAARSPCNLRRITLRYLIADETEGYESDPKEGNMVLLAERRTLSFSNRRIIQASTPKLDQPSFIGDAFAAGDRRLFHVCCVSCQRLTPVAWKDIEWPPDRPEEAYFRCPRCGARVEERAKRCSRVISVTTRRSPKAPLSHEPL